MMKLRITLIFFILFQFYDAFACSCALSHNLTERRDNDFRNSDFVFIGDVINIGGDFSDRHFSILIVEPD